MSIEYWRGLKNWIDERIEFAVLVGWEKTLFEPSNMISNNPEKTRKLIMVLSTIIEIAWIIGFTLMEIILDGSKNVFSHSTSSANSILSSIQFFNPLQYSILIIEAMTHLMIIPTALAQYLTGYDYIYVIAGSIISLISVMYVYIRRMEDSYFE